MKTACLYVADFPAWSFQQTSPELSHVAVHERGVVIARSTALKQSGLNTGDAVERARALYPNAVFLKRNFPQELMVWEDTLARLNTITPRIRDVEPGLAFFTPYAQDEVHALAGELGVQIGTAPFRCYALLAAVRAAPRNALHISKRNVDAFLQHWPVAYLLPLKFEEEFIERLKLFGLGTAAHLRPLSRRHLDAQFGEEGVRLHRLLHPSKDDEAPVPLFRPAPAVSATYDFDDPAVEPGPLLQVLDHLLDRAVQELGERHCCRLVLRLSGSDGGLIAAESRFLRSATNEKRRLWLVADPLLQGMLNDSLRVAAVEVILGGLCNPGREQAELFHKRPPIRKAIQAVHDRFPEMIRRAVIDVAGPAFHEDEFHFEPFKPPSGK